MPTATACCAAATSSPTKTSACGSMACPPTLRPGQPLWATLDHPRSVGRATLPKPRACGLATFPPTNPGVDLWIGTPLCRDQQRRLDFAINGRGAVRNAMLGSGSGQKVKPMHHVQPRRSPQASNRAAGPRPGIAPAPAPSYLLYRAMRLQYCRSKRRVPWMSSIAMATA